ncbi:hypothetical protein K504DRAFT_500885 [Pleomassaria siparia CBS 279.74]|uniref:Protein kinase domain-containing protein n=1 Tax=Pleomassaria siparia CBS 279.74 TaxID=1314801 RepID=A0A6G1KET7_9PLEO|nr:hypothetical protein K504DRAFT_500885 [Pleomassaria siparia CBS 279.74]
MGYHQQYLKRSLAWQIQWRKKPDPGPYAQQDLNPEDLEPELVGDGIPEHRDDMPSIFMECGNERTVSPLIQNYDEQDLRLPERFLWHLFEGLVSAAACCHKVVATSKSDPKDVDLSWNIAIHRDIAPTNTFLMESLGWTHPGVELVDFGYAIIKLKWNTLQNPPSSRLTSHCP